ncbi:SDR family NAD(P)-dependent oxidoreductase [Chloroflexota bacterium]
MKLKNKVVIVTGGASGIGRESSLEMARQGADLVVADLNLEGARVVVNEIEELGSKAIAVAFDQAKYEDAQILVDESIRAFGEINVLFANAGIASVAALVSCSRELWEKTINVDLNGTFYVCQAVANKMIKQKKGGTIIITSSLVARVPAIRFGAYSAAKAGTAMLAKCLAVELGNYRINVNAILPGIVDTPMGRNMFIKDRIQFNKDRIQRDMKAAIPLGRGAQPQDIARVVSFLASEEAAYITGQDIIVDGGWGITSAFQWFPMDYSIENEICT